jgi:photosystem II stability/assembly factor-like uncharacterized protein
MSLKLTRRGAIASAAALGACAALEPRRPALVEGPLPAWTKLPTTEFRGKQDDVVMLPSGVGWYGNGLGKIYKTVDDGASWAEAWSRPGTYVRALGFADETLGFMGNIAPGVYPNVTDPHPLYVTRDGGATWTPAPAPQGPELKGVCAIDVLRPRRGPVTVRAAGRVSGPAILATSRDGGASWTSQDLGQLTGMILDVKFLDERTGFICGSTTAAAQTSTPVILKTSDGGASWRRVHQGNRLFEITWKAAFPTPEIGYVTIQNYNPDKTVSQRFVAKTTDGGETWTEHAVIDSHPWRAFGVGFVDERTGWIGGTTTGVETRDGGLTWKPVEMGRAVNKIRVVRSPRAVEAFAIGSELHRLRLPA